jgi:hypothetical protein
MAKKASSGGTGSGKNSKGGGAKSRRSNYKKRKKSSKVSDKAWKKMESILNGTSKSQEIPWD